MITIGYLSTFYHTSLLMMAQHEDLENTLGTPTQWKLFGNGPDIIAALGRGDLDLAYVGLPPAIIGIDSEVPVTCVAGGHIEGTVICGNRMHKGFPDTQELQDVLGQFRGHRVAVPGKGSIHDVIMNALLERYGLEDDVETVHFPWADQILDAIVKGKVEAAAGTPALAVAVRHYADGKILYPPSKLWPYNPSYGIVAERQFLQGRRDLIERFLLTHEHMTAFLRERPSEAAKVISGYVGIVDTDYVTEVLQISPKYCAQLTDEYIAATNHFVITLKKLGYISREIPADEIFDLNIIRRIHPDPGHY